MQLSRDRESLGHLDEPALLAAIRERRTIIRGHRDAHGDNRCWVDDHAVWMEVEGLDTYPVVPFEYEAVMAQCAEFYHCRRADQPDQTPPDAIINPARWDDDLASRDSGWLLNELVRIQSAIIAHYEANHRPDRPATADDDRALYAILPEKIGADLRLPPEDHFLGEARAPEAGCPAFWRSHEGCGPECDPTKWGPCKK